MQEDESNQTFMTQKRAGCNYIQFAVYQDGAKAVFFHTRLTKSKSTERKSIET
jgi:hypothetical protein